MLTNDDLEALLMTYDKIGFSFRDILNPGVASVALDELESTLPFKLTQDLRTLYEWRNGVELYNPKVQDAKIYGFIWDYSFNSVDEAVALYQYFADHKMFMSGHSEETWLPIMESGGGDYFWADCGEHSASHGCVLHSMKGELGASELYQDIQTMVLSIRQCVADGAYSLDETGGWAIDERKEGEITSRLNPRTPYWNAHVRGYGEPVAQEGETEDQGRAKAHADELENPKHGQVIRKLQVDWSEPGKVSIYGIYSKGSKVLFASGRQEDIPASLWREVRRSKSGKPGIPCEEIGASDILNDEVQK